MHGLDILGAAINVPGTAQRFDELDPTNRMLLSLWTQKGLALSQRATQAAQDILNKAVVPTNEFSLHDSVVSLDNRAKLLSNKVMALPLDDNPAPTDLWNEVKTYFIDGGNLVNQLEGVRDGSLKWDDVKKKVTDLAQGTTSYFSSLASGVKWAVIGGIGLVVIILGVVVVRSVSK